MSVDEVVVFIIGMRIHRWRKVRSWWPVLTGMPRMIGELQQADAGLLGAHAMFAGRTFAVVQYWRSAAELGAYARNSAMRHAPAWGAFNRRTAGTGDVGIFHETYVVPRDNVETLYGNMAPFGLAAAHGQVGRGDSTVRNRAHRDLATTEPDYTDA